MKKANRCTGPKRKVSAITFVVINRNEFGFNFNLLMHTLSSASYLAIIKLLSNIEVVQKLEQLFQHFKFTAFLKHSTRKLGMIWSFGQPYTLTHLDVCCALTHKILDLWHSFDVNNKMHTKSVQQVPQIQCQKNLQLQLSSNQYCDQKFFPNVYFHQPIKSNHHQVGNFFFLKHWSCNWNKNNSTYSTRLPIKFG